MAELTSPKSESEFSCGKLYLH